MMNEQWLPIIGFEGLYEVSSHGLVRSLPRKVNGPKGPRQMRGRVLRPRQHNDGRYAVQLWKNNTGYSRLVQTLVLEAFRGPRPVGMFGCHNDGDNQNNHVSNLRWDTPASNSHDMLIHGTNPYINRSHCPFEHVLRMPNLVRDRWEKDGERACRACALARGACYRAKKRGVELDFVVEAARRYQRIMQGEVS